MNLISNPFQVSKGIDAWKVIWVTGERHKDVVESRIIQDIPKITNKKDWLKVNTLEEKILLWGWKWDLLYIKLLIMPK